MSGVDKRRSRASAVRAQITLLLRQWHVKSRIPSFFGPRRPVGQLLPWSLSTVVWQGSAGDRRPYADQSAFWDRCGPLEARLGPFSDRFRFHALAPEIRAAFCIVFTPLSTSEINTKIGPSAIIHAGALAVLKGGGRAVRVRGKDRCYYLFGLMQSVAVMPQIKIVAKNPFLTWPTDVCLRHREHQ